MGGRRVKVEKKPRIQFFFHFLILIISLGPSQTHYRKVYRSQKPSCLCGQWLGHSFMLITREVNTFLRAPA